MNWKRLFVYNYYTELWKTPTKYLVCIKYEGLFKFFKKYDDAKKFALEISKSC